MGVVPIETNPPCDGLNEFPVLPCLTRKRNGWAAHLDLAVRIGKGARLFCVSGSRQDDVCVPGSLRHENILHHQMLELRQSLARSEEHTSELQSRPHLVCRLLLEK